MLSVASLIQRDGVGLYDVTCRHCEGQGTDVERATSHMLVFVRRGCFVRSTASAESLLDPTLAYFTNPGDAQRFDHPHDGGDDCTALELDAVLAAGVWGGEPALPTRPLRSTAELDLEQRRLLADGRRGADPHELVERTITLAARLLEQADPRRTDSGRPATARRRERLVDDVRESLAHRPDRSLPELARDLAVSPHHLSRIFRSATGHTIARHRLRLRARAALERLAAGDDLARLAAELGFADQSHLSRVLRAETGSAPASLRRALTV